MNAEQVEHVLCAIAAHWLELHAVLVGCEFSFFTQDPFVRLRVVEAESGYENQRFEAKSLQAVLLKAMQHCAGEAETELELFRKKGHSLQNRQSRMNDLVELCASDEPPIVDGVAP